jgi:hypothetical protein
MDDYVTDWKGAYSYARLRLALSGRFPAALQNEAASLPLWEALLMLAGDLAPESLRERRAFGTAAPTPRLEIDNAARSAAIAAVEPMAREMIARLDLDPDALVGDVFAD